MFFQFFDFLIDLQKTDEKRPEKNACGGWLVGFVFRTYLHPLIMKKATHPRVCSVKFWNVQNLDCSGLRCWLSKQCLSLGFLWPSMFMLRFQLWHSSTEGACPTATLAVTSTWLSGRGRSIETKLLHKVLKRRFFSNIRFQLCGTSFMPLINFMPVL